MAVEAVGDYNPKELEEKILRYWRQEKVMEESLKPRGGKRFSFLEGPPTANAPPALHHVEMRTFKDVVNRFQYMQGKSVPRKAGWDCHGLPVEVQVEKELQLKNKKDILDYGLDKFIEKCRTSVFSHIKEWDSLTDRMAYWVDLKDPYITMDNNYIESIWWSLKKLFDEGLLYEGYRVVPLCTRCGTPLSSHEVAQGYKTVKEDTIIVSFPVKDKEFSILAWTTTPWTLLSNVALAVKKGVKYAKILYQGEKYVLAKELAVKRFPDADILEEMDGADLVGMEYVPLFNHFIGKLDKPCWKIISGDFVTTEDGTGVVHIAPAFGEDDYNVGVENNLPMVNPIDLDGKFTKEVPELAGIFAKDADPKIIALLEERGSVVAKYPYEHEYPYCWRCKTPLLYYSMKSWFIKVSDHVNDLMNQNKKITWYPATIGEGRFGNWLENARDWSLSRNRFWGTPLPIWECECGQKKAIGSRKELIENSKGKTAEDIDLHRPYVDEVVLRCSCGKDMKRAEYVIDCWYDSGAAPFAQYHYPFENQKLFNESFPYDYISEATDQTRGWFYTLLVESTLLFGKPAYTSCVVGGLLLDDNGEKMSKSNKNIIDPWSLFETVGADAVRLQMCSTAPWNTKRFGTESMKESVLPVLRTLWNCYSFTVRYMILDGFDPIKHGIKDCTLSVEDMWILSAADATVEKAKKAYDIHDYHHVVSIVSNYIVEDLSRWYIKLIRDRLWLEDNDGKINPSKKAAYMTLANVFERICTILAPIAPFISDEIYLNLLKKDVKSIHLSLWPKETKVDERLNTGMNIVRAIFEAGSNCRQEANIKLRYPIAKVQISGDANVCAAVSDLEEIIAKQLNAKRVEYVNEIPGISYTAVPDYRIIGPKYGKTANQVANAIKENPEKAKRIKDTGLSAEINGLEITSDMISEIRLVVEKDHAASGFTVDSSAGVVLIDTKRTKELVDESLARDIIRHIQEERKRKNLEELQLITVELSKTSEVESMMHTYAETIKKEVRASEITLLQGLKAGKNLTFEGKDIQYQVIV
ncbi:MAG: isoleucine--tRNA ligase [Candidatus Altiarchaeota archaeon]|nr:isoleucine--tRNA ligase [Candidatus Altiarchaeota archaeon]